ncbi:MAG: hypothetical protein JRC86_09070 [Deltaproteobacteria bacterium]|nr:hypothetical protein [Deltaproteobacteria bacterium]
MKEEIRKGKEIAGLKKKAEAEKLELEKSTRENEKLLNILKENVETARATVEAAKKAVSDQAVAKFDGSEYDSKVGILKAEISSQKETTEGELFKLNAKKTEIQGEIDGFSEKLSTKTTFEKATSRIKELEEDQKTLSSEHEGLEGELYMIEQFIIKKVEMLSEPINSMFTMTKFKLFEIQQNGGVNECCEATVNGVPFQDLNNAARINCALDVINTFSKKTGEDAPIFIDNAESIVNIIETLGQQIRLVVSAKHKELTMEG